MNTPEYQLVYWPTLPGRGEYIRLLFEATKTPYVDVARGPTERAAQFASVMRYVKGGAPGLPPLAPPILVHGEVVLAQVANICLYLAPRLGLVPGDERARVEANQLQLTIADLVAEAHDTHHPVGKHAYYEDQKPEALAYTRGFVNHRLAKYLGYFERVLSHRGTGHLVGDALSYVDISLAHTVDGLSFAFPRAMSALADGLPQVLALRARVNERPALEGYRASARCLPFNNDGIFRRYPELDLLPTP